MELTTTPELSAIPVTITGIPTLAGSTTPLADRITPQEPTVNRSDRTVLTSVTLAPPGHGVAADDIARLPEHDHTRREEVLVTSGPRCADGNGTLTPLFFSDDLVDIGRAKAICGNCTRRDNCLSDALEREEPWGVWGGELLLNGRIVTTKRSCGRPPKRPRPAVVIDELGIVEVPTESVA